MEKPDEQYDDREDGSYLVIEIEWNGMRLTLLSERAIWYKDGSTLYIADLHFGKDAVFRRHGIAIPAAIGAGDLDRLTRLLEQSRARRLVVLGDLLHAASGMTVATHDAFTAWRALHASLEILLVRGNHDRNAGDPPAEWGIVCVPEPHAENSLLLRHEPTETASDMLPALAGHLHPCVTLRGGGRSRLTLPCFWVRPRSIVLPAFTDFAGRPQIFPAAQDRIFVVGEEVVEVAVGPTC